MASHQRPLMGPPETPSRVIQQSPSLFPSLQVSPEMYAHQFSGPATAPAYPNQRLFWDPASINFDESNLPQQYQDHFQFSPASMSTSFASSSTIVPSYTPQLSFPISEAQPYDLPMLQRSSSYSHFGASAYPAPFTTSPRVLPPQIENPSMFLSSPARRFGAADQTTNRFMHNPVPERPAYAHQLEESRREQELKRRRSDVKQPSITRSVMEALKRPVSPKKESRPGLKRSLTHTGVRGDRSLKLQPSSTFVARRSPAPPDPVKQHRPGRSSPLKQVADPIQRTLTASQIARRASMSLAIDENGVAKTIVTDRSCGTDSDVLSESDAESFDGTDLHILHSKISSFAFPESGEAYDQFNRSYSHTKTDSRSTVASTNSAKQSSWHSSASNTRSSDGQHARRKRPLPGTAEMDILMEDRPHGNAQHALRAILEDRSRSMSSQGLNLMPQLHSSPPLQQSHYGAYGASPTTVADPELATPSTDRDSLASNMSTRCVCNSSVLDSSVPMVQCGFIPHASELMADEFKRSICVPSVFRRPYTRAMGHFGLLQPSPWPAP
ncbi:hypothetical protein PV08_10988 [Exophiala spinifera]|uniref:Uncharacterized protein n=1 Tax=Exophiala spinifera TaxID=91928 RepID=A0A0D1Y9M0_9EURO|nr:uncharacterized protein PV08_10988 [Exophiala spinifera]KIW11686.1 hypothetical protein PV08_10988 [Exophiala spinifera]